MSDQPIELTRRKALAALGTVGVASAGAGLGTTAFFSDSEDFGNNQLTAGALDLKVDWQEHYSDWSPDEDDDNSPVDNYPSGSDSAYGEDADDGDTGEFPVGMWGGPANTTGTAEDLQDGYVGFPTSDNWLVEVPAAYADDFLRNTAIEAFPDANDNGIQDRDGDGQPTFGGTDICNYSLDGGPIGADTPSARSDPYRTDATIGDGENPQETSPGDALVNIADIKPGDFGEVTLSFHLCDNDGYVWLTGGITDAAENGVTEPEADDPDEFEGVVELLDRIRVSLWYDYTPNANPETSDDAVDESLVTNGDNVKQGDEQYIAQDIPLRSLNGLLNDPNDVGFQLDAVPGDSEPGVLTCLDTTQDSLPSGFGESPDWNVDLTGVSAGGTAGSPAATAGPNDEIAIFNVQTNGAGDVTQFDWQYETGTGLVGVGVCTFDLTDVNGNTDDRGDEEECTTAANSVRFGGNGISSVRFDVCRVEQQMERDCFVGSNTYSIGLAWWLPVDHGNEVQTDSVEFDLGFYTEQCRHNDGGPAQEPENGGNGDDSNG